MIKNKVPITNSKLIQTFLDHVPCLLNELQDNIKTADHVKSCKRLVESIAISLGF